VNGGHDVVDTALAARVTALEDELAELRSRLGAGSGRPASPFLSSHVVIEDDVRLADGVRVVAADADHRVVLMRGSALYRGTEVMGPFRLGRRSFVNRGGFIQAGS
jgi:hypothetical protein